ncbi:MAG: hypothetical protein II842_07065 [Butyrivibrio sp.]|nr:hypothetical protein [Butyrivibrio sp.]
MDSFGMMNSFFKEKTEEQQSNYLSQSANNLESEYLNDFLKDDFITQELEKQKKEQKKQAGQEPAQQPVQVQQQKQQEKEADQLPAGYVGAKIIKKKQLSKAELDQKRVVDLNNKINKFKEQFSNEKMVKDLTYMAKKTSKKDANATNHDLFNAANAMNVLYCYYGRENAPMNIDLGMAIDNIIRLNIASDAYRHTHRGHQSSDGEVRLKAANKYLFMTNYFMSKITTRKEENEITGTGKYADIDTSKKSLNKYAKDMGKVADAIVAFNKSRGEMSSAESNEEYIEQKLKVYRKYDKEIRLYRHCFKEDEWTDKKKQVIREYENLLRMEKILQFKKSIYEEQEQTLENVVDEHIQEEDKKKNVYQVNKDTIDEGLTKAQIEGVDKIDKWLIDNAQNGGLLGLVFCSFKNDHANFINTILSKSKREKLYMYYLVESDQRKNPSILDLSMSQEVYVPNLDVFADKMKASPLKFYKRFTGEYTYMHKLSEAYQINEKNKDLLETTANIHNNKYEEPNQANDIFPEEKLNSQRIIAFKELYVQLASLRRAIVAAQEANARDRTGLEITAKDIAALAEKKLKAVVEADEEFKKNADDYLKTHDEEVKKDTHNAVFNKTADRKEMMSMGNVIFGTAPSKLVTSLHTVKEMKGFNWGLDSSWRELHLWTGSLASSLSAVSSALVVVSTLINLVSRGGQMTLEDITENLTSLAKGAVDFTKAGSTIVDLVHAGGQYGDKILSETTKNLGITGAVLDGGIALEKTYTVTKQFLAQKNMKEYFKEKHKEMPLNEREEKLEKGLIKLSDDVIERKKTAARCHYRMATAGIISVTIPGIPGTIAAVIGGVQAIATSINDSKKLKSLRANLFDHYYNVDGLIDAVNEYKRNNSLNYDTYQIPDSEKLKPIVRLKILSKEGLSDLGAASTKIAGIYANFIHGKLFGSQKATGPERNAYLEALKAFNMEYNEEKGYPTEFEIFKCLRG